MSRTPLIHGGHWEKLLQKSLMIQVIPTHVHFSLMLLSVHANLSKYLKNVLAPERVFN